MTPDAGPEPGPGPGAEPRPGPEPRPAPVSGTGFSGPGADGAPRPGKDTGRGAGPLGRRLFAAFAVVALASIALLTAAALIGTERGIGTARQADRQRVADRVAAAAADAYRRADGWEGADLGPARTIALGAEVVLTVRDADGHMLLSPGGGHGGGPGTGQGRGQMHGVDRDGTGDTPDSADPAPGAETSAAPDPSTAPDPSGGQGPSAGQSPSATPGPGSGPGPGTSSGRAVTADIRADGRTVGSVHLGFPAASGTEGRDIAWGWIAAAALAALALALAVSWYVTRRLTGPVVRVAHTARAIAAGDRTARSRVDAPGELGELSRAFDTMADDVTRAERARRRLAADVAHELRTPLAALQAGLEELRDGYAEPAPERLAALHDQTLRLGRIVGDLAELSAAESARLSLHRTTLDVTELVRGAVRDREPELRAAGLIVRTRPAAGPLPVHADGDRLHQALGNLLSNTARYCRPGDTVTVTARAEPRKGAGGGVVVIEVADDGPGIPAAELPYVFDRLWRGSAARDVGGSGIGLAVVKELVTAHGGTVEASSGPEGGTVITLRLPAAPPGTARN
ncbi:HAMP domain-containing histidine kinase [Streptomyces sp. S07_1.15]|uniref:HAMP domain-containing sensor histidine kinase n=1 Tax=Streptomyces sp. S07_1.15 TaxID=2873925 RepID=UPI001D140702|nr:HAMP domain-containing sensor histidine kinase [Streptomyces sp. S07_1.15]MCC3650236.1 HAMP domain-containing histidine kinase [Streptomyces sp. S07_1.15]